MAHLPISMFLTCIAGHLLMAGGDPQTDQYFPLQGDYAASHILIAHKRAERAGPTVTRSKKEALAKCEELLARLKKQPELFEELAKTESDGPSAPAGGDLGGFRKGMMAPAFETALKKLNPGEITQKPVKTPFGYHIIRRNSMKAKYYGARQILVHYRDAAPVRALREGAATRSREEARARIQDLAARVNASNFEKMAASQSDLPTQNGFAGVFKRGDSAMAAQLGSILENLDYDEVSDVVEIAAGFALLKRIKVEQRAGSRIWISYQGAARTPATVTRTKAEARTLAEEVAALLREDSSRFESLAETHSDGPFAIRGGVMPNWFVGYQDPAFEEALEALAVGTVTEDPVETPSGYYLIKRNPLH